MSSAGSPSRGGAPWTSRSRTFDYVSGPYILVNGSVRRIRAGVGVAQHYEGGRAATSLRTNLAGVEAAQHCEGVGVGTPSWNT